MYEMFFLNTKTGGESQVLIGQGGCFWQCVPFLKGGIVKKKKKKKTHGKDVWFVPVRSLAAIEDGAKTRRGLSLFRFSAFNIARIERKTAPSVRAAAESDNSCCRRI